MEFECSNCLYKSNHPFGLGRKNKICSGCITHREKLSLKENRADEYLYEILKSAKKNKKITYHCVIPVIGDAEDYYTVTKILKEGLNPLIVSVNSYFMNDIGWHNLQNLITHFDLDSIIFNPDIFVYKELVRTSLRKFDHVLWPFLSLHTSFPVHVAMQRKIPLVIWGQNQSIEQVGKCSHYDRIEMNNWSRHEHDLFGVSVQKMIGNGAQLDTRSLNYYHYPSTKLLSDRKIKGIYLSNYMNWDPLYQNQKALSQGFIPEHNISSFDPYERAGSSVYYRFHDLLKFKRVGYRKIRDHLSREIRHKRISRKNAVKMEKEYSSNRVNLERFFQWLEVTKSGFDWFVKHRLHEIKHLVGEDSIVTAPDLSLFSGLIQPGEKAKEHFLMYSKQLHL